MNNDQKNILDRTLITGASGMVGGYIDFGTKMGRDSLDITDHKKVVDVLKKYQPKVIVHLAAETDMKKCEEDPAHAYLVNTVGTYNLAIVAKEVGAKMVYVSTDAVFPTSHKPHPINNQPSPESVYGHSKYLAELAVRGISDDYIIARTSWVFGGGKEKDKKFVAKFIEQLSGEEAKAVNDQFSSPTFAKDLVEGLKKLIREDKNGIFHVVNTGAASRYDMALVIAKTLNKKTKITPVSSSAFGLLSYQQSSGGLVANIKMRSWQDSLKEYLETEWKNID